MMRIALGELLLFLVPFAAFAIYLLVRRRNPARAEAWSGSIFWLAVAGLVLAAGALLVYGVTAERQGGAFVPTHVEDGRVVPGRFR